MGHPEQAKSVVRLLIEALKGFGVLPTVDLVPTFEEMATHRAQKGGR